MPKKYLEQDEDTRAYLTRYIYEKSWFENGGHAAWMVPRARRVGTHDCPPRSAKAASSPSQSIVMWFFITSHHHTQRREAEESRQCGIQELRYETKLVKKGNSFMTMDEEGHWQESKDKCRKLLSERFTFFSDRVFESTCERVANQNEAKAIDKIARLVAPSAVDLADFGAEHLEKLVVTINEGWENSISVTHLVLSLTKLWDSTDRIYRNPGTLPEDWSFHRCGQPLYLVDLPCHQHFLFKHSMLPCNDRSTDVFWTAPVIGDRGQSVWDTVR